MSAPGVKEGEHVMHEIITDFMLRQRPAVDAEKMVVELGTADTRPELRTLHDDEAVVLIYPGNLKTRGHVVIDTSQGTPYFYGVIDGAIENDAP